MILLVQHQMILSIAMDNRLETWYSLWQLREGRLKNFNPVNFPKYDGDIGLFLGQDISHKLPPKQPPETALSESTAQDTSLFQSGSLSETSETWLSQSYSVKQSNYCSLQLNCLSEGYRSVWLQFIRGECIFTRFPGGCVLTWVHWHLPPRDRARTQVSNPGNVTYKDCSVANTQKQILLCHSFT